MPLDVLKTLYNAHVLPHLQYCTPIWCSTYPTHLVPLFRLQKRMIRIVTNSDFFAHTQQLFKDSCILNVFDINKLQIATYMFKMLHVGRTVDLQPQHNYPTSTREILRIPLHNLTLYQHSLSYLGPKIWNGIPNSIQALPTLSNFKRKLKSHIVNQYWSYDTRRYNLCST